MSVPADRAHVPGSPGRPTTTTVMRGTAWFLTGRAFNALVAILATPLIVRLLGPERYGAYVLLLLLIGYATAADLGMGVAAIRFASTFHEQGKRELEGDAVWSGAWLAAVGSAALLVLVEVGARFPLEWARVAPSLWHDTIVAMRITAVTIFVANVGGVFMAPQLSRLRYALNSSTIYGANILRYASVCAGLFVEISLTNAAWGIMFSSVCVAAVLVLIAFRIAPQLRSSSFNPSVAGPMLRFGTAAVFSSLATAAVSHAEKLLLARFAPLSELAYYAIAFSVAGTLLVVPTALAQAALPAFAREQSSGRKESLVYDRLLRASVLWLLPAAATLAVMTQPILYYWVGPNYVSHSTVAVRVLLVGFVANGLAQIPYQALLGAGRTDLIAYILTAEVAPAITLAFVMIRRYGSLGAASAWSLESFLGAVLMFVVVRHTLGWKMLPWGKTRFWFGLAVLVILCPIVVGELVAGNMALKVALLAGCLGTYSVIVWQCVLAGDERSWLLRMILLKEENRVHP